MVVLLFAMFPTLSSVLRIPLSFCLALGFSDQNSRNKSRNEETYQANYNNILIHNNDDVDF